MVLTINVNFFMFKEVFMENTKMKNLARTLDTIIKVGGEIFRAVGIVCAIVAVLLAIFGGKMIAMDTEASITLGFIKLYVSDYSHINTGFMNAYIVIGLLTVMILCFAIFFASRLLHSILEPIKSGRPFESEIPTNLRKFAWIILGCGALTQIMNIIECVLISKAFNLKELLSSDVISRIEHTYTLDFSFVLVFAVIMFLSYIFSYGQRLQQESDETL